MRMVSLFFVVSSMQKKKGTTHMSWFQFSYTFSTQIHYYVEDDVKCSSVFVVCLGSKLND